LKSRHFVRPLLASAAIAAAVALAGCNTDTDPAILSGRANQPLSDKMLAEIEQKGMAQDSAILVRVFKEEAELEVWKEDRTGRFALLKTYPICRWSGELGPKVKEGDRQAPEGFYMITPALMNPNSNFYLAINLGFPNAYDRAHGRTGGFLMIHGDCSSRGCYAMTDEQIAEIYALARESFFGGQRAFQIQAYPFRMTPMNVAKHRNSPHMAFWRMLKQGYDHFEVTRLEPKVDVCERRYVFDAESKGKFNASERCPAYTVPADIAAAVRDKTRRDDIQIADLSNRGVPTAPIRTGNDGGMNPTYLAALKQYGGPGAAIRTAAGTIPTHVNPPGDFVVEPQSTGSLFGFNFGSRESKPPAGPRSSVQVAAATPENQGGSSGGIGGFFGNLFGSKGESDQAGTRAPARPAETHAPKSKAIAARPTPAAGAIRPKNEPQQTAAKPAGTKPQAAPQPTQQASAEPPRKPAGSAAGNDGLLNGAAPTVPANAFDNRFGSWR
jgi:murein L,D-transpeptidase YafK